MDAFVSLLFGLGILSLCLAAFVFAEAARTYVSGHASEEGGGGMRNPRYFVQRSRCDRRQRGPREFPIEVKGVTIVKERRSGGDRRSPPGPGGGSPAN